MRLNLFAKMRNASTIVKATIVFGISSFAVNGINYLTTPIFTRLMSTSEFGVVGVYNTWLQIIIIFASLTLVYPGVLNVGLYEHSDNRWKYLSSIAGVITCSTGVLFILYLVFGHWISILTGMSESLLLLMVITCLTLSAQTLWLTKQRYEYNYKIAAIVTIGTALIAQIVSVIAVVLARQNGILSLAEVRLWSAGLVNILTGAVLYFYILRQGKKPVDIPLWGNMIRLTLPLFPHYLSWVLLQGTDKLMISWMVGDDKTGIYTLAATLSSIGILFWRALSSTVAPFINAKLGERQFGVIDEVIKPLLLMVCLTCLLGVLAAPEIIRVMATEEYMSGIYAIPPVVIGIYLHVLYEVFSSVAFFRKKTVRIMIPSLVAAVLNLVLNYIFILLYGFIAAGYTTMVSNLLLVAMHYYNVRVLEKERIFDGRFILVSVGALSALCLSCNFLYQFNIVRYVAMAVVMILIVRMRKPLVGAINKMKV